MHQPHMELFWRVVDTAKIALTKHQIDCLGECVDLICERAYNQGWENQALLTLAGRETFIADLRAEGALSASGGTSDE